jgi:hypothetical protein
MRVVRQIAIGLTKHNSYHPSSPTFTETEKVNKLLRASIRQRQSMSRKRIKLLWDSGRVLFFLQKNLDKEPKFHFTWVAINYCYIRSANLFIVRSIENSKINPFPNYITNKRIFLVAPLYLALICSIFYKFKCLYLKTFIDKIKPVPIAMEFKISFSFNYWRPIQYFFPKVLFVGISLFQLNPCSHLYLLKNVLHASLSHLNSN